MNIVNITLNISKVAYDNKGMIVLEAWRPQRPDEKYQIPGELAIRLMALRTSADQVRDVLKTAATKLGYVEGQGEPQLAVHGELRAGRKGWLEILVHSVALVRISDTTRQQVTPQGTPSTERQAEAVEVPEIPF